MKNLDSTDIYESTNIPISPEAILTNLTPFFRINKALFFCYNKHCNRKKNSALRQRYYQTGKSVNTSNYVAGKVSKKHYWLLFHGITEANAKLPLLFAGTQRWRKTSTQYFVRLTENQY
jgi:hypothetical protein